jgi:hypothetical protein
VLPFVGETTTMQCFGGCWPKEPEITQRTSHLYKPSIRSIRVMPPRPKVRSIFRISHLLPLESSYFLGLESTRVGDTHYLKIAWIWGNIQGVTNSRRRTLKYTQAKTSSSRDGDQDQPYLGTISSFRRFLVESTLMAMTRKQLQWSWRCSKLAHDLKMFGTPMY